MGRTRRAACLLLDALPTELAHWLVRECTTPEAEAALACTCRTLCTACRDHAARRTFDADVKTLRRLDLFCNGTKHLTDAFAADRPHTLVIVEPARSPHSIKICAVTRDAPTQHEARACALRIARIVSTQWLKWTAPRDSPTVQLYTRGDQHHVRVSVKGRGDAVETLAVIFELSRDTNLQWRLRR